MLPDATLEAAYDHERRRLFGLAYRLTGSAADAEDAVQETFVRALARPPADTSLAWGPWLGRVLINLCLDRLRARQQAGYVGPWLPEALETDPALFADEPTGEARYSELESVTVAFLVALEELSPDQRAVLVLRDVMGESVAETAVLLSLTEGNVKVLHHRARQRLDRYDREHQAPRAEVRERTLDRLQRLMQALLSDDVTAMAALLRADVLVTNDGGGDYSAARRPFRGRDVAITFHRKIRDRGEMVGWRIAMVNGLPALVMQIRADDPHLAPLVLFQVECDAEGQIHELRSTLARAKVARLGPTGDAPPGA